MQTTLILIRGNSGSGKTTLARKLQQTLGPNTLLVSQDVVRRDMCHTADTPGNLAIDLIQQIATYGQGKVPVVIVEGILARDRYQSMLQRLVTTFPTTHAYYFDLPFETTLTRHQTKPQATEYGAPELRKWWLPADYLTILPETRFTASDTPTTELRHILADLNFSKSASR